MTQEATHRTDHRIDRLTGTPGDRQCPNHEVMLPNSDRGEARVVVRSYELARQLLKRPEGTKQAGFNVELLGSAIGLPMLYTEGDVHRDQRRLSARFFTPRTVTTQHRAMIEQIVDEAVASMEARGTGQVDAVAFRVALRVVAQIVGLTNSNLSRMETLLNRFFSLRAGSSDTRRRRTFVTARNHALTAWFYAEHVRPAIRERRRRRGDDLISMLIERGLNDADIVVEVVTYAAAGMVTTRELMTISVWQMLRHPELRQRFVAGSDADRRAVITEILRLDPVGSRLMRRATEPIVVRDGDDELRLDPGALVEIEVRATNADERAVGACPLTLDPDRQRGDKVPASGLAFGAGHHSCPGEPLALEETDIFLRRFWRTDWQLDAEPHVGWNQVAQSYDIDGLRVRVP